MSCSPHVLKELETILSALKTGNSSIKEQKELHKKLHSVKQQCDMTKIPQTIRDEGGDNLGVFGANQMPPLSLARVEIPRSLPPSLINSAPLPNRTPTAADFRRFQTPQPQPQPDRLSQFRVPQPDRLSQFRVPQTPSALDFSIMEKELLELSKKSANTSRPVSRHSPQNLESSRMAEALTLNPSLAKLPGYSELPAAPPHLSNIVDEDEYEDDIYGDNDDVDPRAPRADMSHLCLGPGCHYPRYDIRPVRSEPEPAPEPAAEPPKFKARMGGSSRRRSRNRTPPRKSRKRTPPKRSRTPQRRSRTQQRRTRTVRRSKRK